MWPRKVRLFQGRPGKILAESAEAPVGQLRRSDGAGGIRPGPARTGKSAWRARSGACALGLMRCPTVAVTNPSRPVSAASWPGLTGISGPFPWPGRPTHARIPRKSLKSGPGKSRAIAEGRISARSASGWRLETRKPPSPLRARRLREERKLYGQTLPIKTGVRSARSMRPGKSDSVLGQSSRHQTYGPKCPGTCRRGRHPRTRTTRNSGPPCPDRQR